MSHIVQLRPSGYVIVVEEHETVLEAALRQGYDFPHDCCSGICSTCQGQVLAGSVDYGDNEIYAIDEEQQALGEALFCSAYPQTDLLIQVDDVTGPDEALIKTLSYDLAEINESSTSVTQVLLQAPADDHLQYRAGQYLYVIPNKGDARPFSIGNCPTDERMIELHIRHTQDNEYANQLLDEIKSHKKLNLRGPYGTTVFHRDINKPIIFIAGGTGFAPLKAIIEHVLIEDFQQSMHLYWGAKTLGDLYMHQLAQTWVAQQAHFNYTPVLSDPSDLEDWHGVSESIDEAVLADYPDLSNHVIYACGPSEMVFDALKTLKAHGLKEALMFSDAFTYGN